MWFLTCNESSLAEACRCANGLDEGLSVMLLSADAHGLLLLLMEVSADLGRADVLDSGVGEAVVLCGSVGKRFGGFFELPLSGAMMFPTDKL